MCTCPVIHRHNTGGEKTGPFYSEEVTTSRPEEKWASLGEVPCVNVAGASEPRKVAHPFPRAELVYLRGGEMPAQEKYPQGSSHLTRRDYLDGGFRDELCCPIRARMHIRKETSMLGPMSARIFLRPTVGGACKGGKQQHDGGAARKRDVSNHTESPGTGENHPSPNFADWSFPEK